MIAGGEEGWGRGRLGERKAGGAEGWGRGREGALYDVVA